MTTENKPVVRSEIALVEDAPPIDAATTAQPPRKRPSWFLIVLPLIVTPPWVVLMSLYKFVEDVFSIPAALTAAFLLSAVLLAIRRKNLPLKWALLPLLCWIYECTPFSLPGPFDELLAVGGSGMDVFWAWLKKPEKNKPPRGSA